MRVFPLALAGVIAVSAAWTEACARPADADVIVAPVPSGRLADALFALAAEADINIAFDAALVGDRRTSGFAEPTTLREALRRLLGGTGLAFTLSPSGNVSVWAAPQPIEPLSASPDDAEAQQRETIVVYAYRDALDRAELRARRYDGLVEIVSADAIGKLPDANIADALNRLPSVYRITDQGEGRYLALRGVSESLNAVTLNGVTIATSDTDGRSGRAAPLDVLSASAVTDVEIHNVITPDRDSNAIGGLINVRTPTAHDFQERIASVTAEVGVADFGAGRDIHALRGAFSDVFGPNGAFGIYLAGEYWAREYLSHFYDNSEITPAASGAPGLYPDRIYYGVSAGRRERSSVTAALDWRGENGNAVWLRAFGADYIDEEVRPEFMLYRRGALSAAGADAFSWRGVRVRTETRHERQERPVRQYVLGGRWALSEAWTLEAAINQTSAQELNPFLNYYETLGDIDPADASAPDIGRFRLTADGFAVTDGRLAAPNGLSIFDGAFQHFWRLRHISSQVREDIDTQQLDLRRRGQIGGRPVSLQFGGKRLARVRYVDDTDDRYNFSGAADLSDPALAGTPADYGWGENYAILPGVDFVSADPDGFEALFAAWPDLFSYDAASSRQNSVEDDYRIHETIQAGYAMAALDLTPALRVTLGARVERTDLSVRANAFVSALSASGFPPGADPFAALPFLEGDIVPVSGARSYTNVSPALLARWDDGGAWIFRASLTNTFARPDYVDVAPISTLSVFATPDAGTGGAVLSAAVETGNPLLRPVESRNWDVSAHYNLPGDVGWVSLAGFYKSLDGLVFDTVEQRENVMFAGARFERSTLETLANSGEGHVAGLEFSVRYDFLDAPAPLDGFGFLFNAAVLESSISAPTRPQARPLANQADLVYTAQLYYERPRFQARLAYAHQGRAPRGDQWSEPDGNNYRAPLARLDLKLVVDLDAHWRAALAGANLTDTPYQTDRSTSPRLIGASPGYEIYGREYRLSLTRRW